MRTNPVSMMAQITLAIITVAFAALTFLQSQEIRTLQGGDGGQDSLPNLVKKVSDERQNLADAQEKLKRAQQALWRLDIELDQLRANDSWLGGAAEADKALGAAQDAKAAKAATDTKDATDGKSAEAKAAEIQIKDSTWHVALHQTEAHRKRLVKALERYTSEAWQTHPDLDAAVRSRQDELAVLAKRISDEEEKFKGERDQLSQQLDEIATNKDKSDRSHRDEVSRLRTRAGQLETDIRKLLELDLVWVSEPEPDGVVREVSGDQVVIDLGRRDHVRPGMRFSVSALDKGVRIGKGMVEIITVDESISTCRLIAEQDARRRPIGSGDSVASPMYERLRTPTFAVAGEFKNVSRQDLESFIRASGAQVTANVGPGVDFLVAGDKSEVEQASARQFQIKAMTQALLMTYIRPVYEPTAQSTAKQ